MRIRPWLRGPRTRASPTLVASCRRRTRTRARRGRRRSTARTCRSSSRCVGTRARASSRLSTHGPSSTREYPTLPPSTVELPVTTPGSPRAAHVRRAVAAARARRDRAADGVRGPRDRQRHEPDRAPGRSAKPGREYPECSRVPYVTLGRAQRRCRAVSTQSTPRGCPRVRYVPPFPEQGRDAVAARVWMFGFV